MYAHYALQKLKILPSQFANLDYSEKAFIIASIQLKIKEESKK